MSRRHVVFVAAENGALPGGKVGGVGDVVRDLPVALAACGWRVTVLTPAYGMFSTLPEARLVDELTVSFAGRRETVEVHELSRPDTALRQLAFEHPLFSAGGAGQIYTERPGEGPFASDATRFALFGAATASWVRGQERAPDVVHLHDWHAAFYCLLRAFAPAFRTLAAIRTVFTIHNLAYQGTRPLDCDESSLTAWFPGLAVDPAIVGDPDNPGCINPMALAIRTCERVSTVSPTYAREILRPSDPARGFVGGEGLERPLTSAARAGRLVGILNGCDYDSPQPGRPDWPDLVAQLQAQLASWREQQPDETIHGLAIERLQGRSARRPRHLLVSIGRLVRQKVSLLFEPLDDGRSALEHVLDVLGQEGMLIVLGSGERDCEARIGEIAKRCEPLLFVRGYSESLAQTLYPAGELFLMPSSFEPCGISQMLAMRAGQPVLAHATGGLCDTIDDGRTGFLFSGDTARAQASAFVAALRHALTTKEQQPDEWQALCTRAAAQRFDWATAARATIDELYAA
ncbi:MAG: glycogen/starch synthase [Wenzhouxiangellaceae bacterium]|nr:glycogen/starch synthase [Wenzhouxiangellaceae bacterium]